MKNTRRGKSLILPGNKHVIKPGQPLPPSSQDQVKSLMSAANVLKMYLDGVMSVPNLLFPVIGNIANRSVVILANVAVQATGPQQPPEPTAEIQHAAEQEKGGNGPPAEPQAEDKTAGKEEPTDEERTDS